MNAPKPVKLADVHLHIRRHGKSEVRAADFSRGVMKDGIIDWDPGVDGILCGESTMTTSSDHQGERHLDGDEVLYLISGRMQLILEPDDSPPSAVEIAPGEAVLVPCRVWHRLHVLEASRLIFMGGGRTQIRFR